MGVNYTSAKRITLTAGVITQAFAPDSNRSFLYLRGPNDPVGVKVSIAFSPSAPGFIGDSFFLRPNEVLRFSGDFVPQSGVYLSSNMDTEMCVASSMPTA